MLPAFFFWGLPNHGMAMMSANPDGACFDLPRRWH